MNQATALVQIATDTYEFGCAHTGQPGHTGERPEPYTWAAPKLAPELRRPLADIRADLAAVYQAQYGSVPNASALGDAMTVLEGKARTAAPIEADETLAAMLAGGDSRATALVNLAKEKFTFGVTSTGEVYAVAIDGPNVARPLRGGRRSLRAELARLHFERTRTAASSSSLSDALLVLEGEAQQGSDPVGVALRVGRDAVGRLVLDLGDDTGRAVVVDARGWSVVESSPVLFWRTNATLPLPTPAYGGRLDRLRDLLNVSDDDWPLVVAWLVAALIPEIPHPVLLLRGEHGTAKSTAARLLTSLLDRCGSQLRTAPRNVEDWCVAAAGSWLTALDNVSDLQHWLQDAICRSVTGDGLLRRQLYTDADVSVLAFRRVVALTSVDPGRLNGDLADRLLTVELERIADSSRASEEDLEAAWAKIHPEALGGLLHLVAQVLAVLPTVRRTRLPRMADYARVVLAVDAVLGTEAYDAYTSMAGKTAENVAEGDSVSIAIRERITSPWTGTVSELLELLTAERPAKDWPATPQGMGGRLLRAAPSLRALGWTVDRKPRQGSSRPWEIAPPARHEEEVPAGSSRSSWLSPPATDLRVSDDDLDADHGHGDDQVVIADPDVTDVSAGHAASDKGDDLGGISSTCLRCGNPLLLRRPGRRRCERCRLADGSAGAA